MREALTAEVGRRAPALLFMTDARGNIEYVNERWTELLGVPVLALLGGNWMTFVHEDDHDALLQATAEAERTGEYRGQFRMCHRDGEYRWVEVRAEAERNARGEIVRWFGAGNDVDEHRRTLQLFAELGVVLSASIEVQSTLDAVLRLVVPAVADWGIVHLAGEKGELRRAAAHHRDAARRAPAAVDAGLTVPILSGGVSRGTLTFGRDDPARGFGPQDAELFARLARRIAQPIANAELYERERRVARSFQDAALPAALPGVPACAFSAIYEAGRAEALIGGDWYDAFTLGDGRIVLSIGDVAGSGLQAAVTMSNMRQAIRGVAYVHPDPVLMLEAADLALRSESPDRFVTAFVAVIDPIENMLTFTTAGHPPPLLRRTDGAIVQLEAYGLPLGLREHATDSGMSCILEPGSLLVLFTDGLIESTHDIDEGYRRLYAALDDAAICASADIATRIRDAVLLEGSSDDVAILCGRYAGVALERHRIDVRDAVATASFATLLVRELASCRYQKDAIVNAEIVFAELIGNLVRHTPGTATFVIDAQDGRIVLHALDDGPGYRFLSRLPADAFSERGRGLFLISSLADTFHVTPRPFGGSHACVTFSTATDDAESRRWSKAAPQPAL